MVLPRTAARTAFLALLSERTAENASPAIAARIRPDTTAARRRPLRYAARCRRTSASGMCWMTHARSNTRA